MVVIHELTIYFDKVREECKDNPADFHAKTKVRKNDLKLILQVIIPCVL